MCMAIVWLILYEVLFIVCGTQYLRLFFLQLYEYFFCFVLSANSESMHGMFYVYIYNEIVISVHKEGLQHYNCLHIGSM